MADFLQLLLNSLVLLYNQGNGRENTGNSSHLRFSPFHRQGILSKGVVVDGNTLPPNTLYGYGSKKCMDVNSGSQANNVTLEIWSCSEGRNQQFEGKSYEAEFYDPVAKEYAALVQVVSKVSDKCLTEETTNSEDDSVVYQYDCDTGRNQLWYGRRSDKSTSENTWFQLVSKSGRCLTVRGGSSDNGALLTVYPCQGSSNQLWLYSIDQ